VATAPSPTPDNDECARQSPLFPKADARGIAHIMRTRWFREVHVKSDASYRLRLLLTQRRNLKRKFLDIENAIRHSIKTFGLRLGRVGQRRIRGAGARAGGR
jgi:transposase